MVPLPYRVNWIKSLKYYAERELEESASPCR